MFQSERAGEDHEKQNKGFQTKVADQRETQKLRTAAISVLQYFYGEKFPCRAKKVPKIQQLIKEFVDTKEPNYVAYGADV